MIRAKHTIRHNGKSYKKGVLVEGLTEAEKQRLVSLKAAEYVISPEEELQKQQVQTPPTYSPEEFEALAADLNENYNADELKRAAKEVGVDLTDANKKDEVIAAIINQGKADELLEDEDGEDDEQDI